MKIKDVRDFYSTSVVLSLEEKQKLILISRSEDRSASAVIRRLIHQEAERLQINQSPSPNG